jgi:hypothetical protein
MLFGSLVSQPDTTAAQPGDRPVRSAGALQAAALTLLGFAVASLLVVLLD